MSFLDKLKGEGRQALPAGVPSHFADLPVRGPDDPPSSGDSTLVLPRRRGSEAASAPVSVQPEPLDSLADSSIITEAAPSEMLEYGDAADAALAGQRIGPGAAAGAALPLIGGMASGTQQKLLLGLIAAGLIGLVATVTLALNGAARSSAQVTASGQALMQSQRLAKAVSQGLVGSAGAFPEVRDSSAALTRSVRGLKNGDAALQPAPAAVQPLIDAVLPLVDRAEKNAAIVAAQQDVLTRVGQGLRAINRQSSDLLDAAQSVAALKLQQGAAPAEVAASGELVMLTQRIGKSANEFLTMEGVSPEAVFLLGKDLNAFKETLAGLTDGNAESKLPGTKDPQTRERLAVLQVQYETLRNNASAILGNLQPMVAAREAQGVVIKDNEALRTGLEAVQAGLGDSTGFGLSTSVPMVVSALLLVLGGVGFLRLYVTDQGQRASVAENSA